MSPTSGTSSLRHWYPIRVRLSPEANTASLGVEFDFSCWLSIGRQGPELSPEEPALSRGKGAKSDCHQPFHPRPNMPSRKVVVVDTVACGVLREVFPVTPFLSPAPSGPCIEGAGEAERRVACSVARGFLQVGGSCISSCQQDEKDTGWGGTSYLVSVLSPHSGHGRTPVGPIGLVSGGMGT